MLISCRILGCEEDVEAAESPNKPAAKKARSVVDRFSNPGSALTIGMNCICTHSISLQCHGMTEGNCCLMRGEGDAPAEKASPFLIVIYF